MEALIDGNRYFVAVDDAFSGARQWETTSIPATDVDAGPELVLRISDFSQGHGYTFTDRQGVYSHADGWDASAPGKITTWPLYTSLAAQTSGVAKPARGYLIEAQDSSGVRYLYVFRGNLGSKFTIEDDTSWTDNGDHNFTTLAGATREVCGQPEVWHTDSGAQYIFVPLDNSAGAPQRFYRIKVGSGAVGNDTASQGPSGITATHFEVWQDKLVRLSSNGTDEAVYSACEFDADPMTASNWGREYTIGDQGKRITGAAVYDRYLMVGKEEGLFSFDESARANNEFADLGDVTHADNCRFMRMWNGAGLMVPHKSGLRIWNPGRTAPVGPQEDGYLDASTLRGWGYVRGMAPYGKYLYAVIDDRRLAKSYLISFKVPGPQDQRGPLVPHMHHVLDGIDGEDCLVVSSASGQAYLVVMDISTVTNAKDTVTCRIYELPEAGFSVSNDANIGKHISGATDLKAQFNVVKSTGASTGFTNLKDSAGSNLSITSTGLVEGYFPSTSDGVGVYCNLRFLVGSKNFDTARYVLGGTDVDKLFRKVTFWAEIGTSGSDKSATVRVGPDWPIKLHYSLMPKTTNLHQFTIVFNRGHYGDGGMEMRTPETQESDLRTLTGPNSVVLSMRDPWGNTFQGRIVDFGPVREVRFSGFESPIKVAPVTVREVKYS